MHRLIFALAAAGALNLVAPSASAATIDGVSDAGALWQITLPDAWNGDLVVYAHGIEEPGKPLEVNPDNFPFPAFAGAGYAVITTSYRSTGWAVKDAFQDVHQLLGIFEEEVGEPTRTYMLGASLGGLVASQQTERFGSQYDGALLFCPPLSGLGASSGYFADIAFLFDVFYPGVLGFDPRFPPTFGSFDVGGMLDDAELAVLSDPIPATQILALMGGEVPGANLFEYAESLLTALAFWAIYGEEANDRANGWAFGNEGVVYSGSAVDSYVNAVVARVEAENRAVNFSRHWYEPDGDLHMPTVILTTVADPVVPLSNTLDYADLVASEGAGDSLAVQTVERYGHCVLSPNEILGAFGSLVGWVQFGVPAPTGDVTNP